MKKVLKKKCTKLLVFYVNIGQVTSDKADAFIEKYKERLNLNKFPDHVATIFIPIRESEHRVEVIDL